MGESPAPAGVGERRILYTIEDRPPIHESVFLGIQHYLTMFGATRVAGLPLFLEDEALLGRDVDRGVSHRG